MQTATFLAHLALFAGAVHAHGFVESPPRRVAGAAFGEACGKQVLSTESSDPGANIQGLRQNGGSNFDATKCNLDLCKGIPFADNDKPDRIQKLSPGQEVPFKVAIKAPHTGVANVSVVETVTNSIVGSPLIMFQNYASTKTGVARNNTDFSVTMPSTLPASCATAGACVLQWWWDSPEAKQTYMSCVDFVTPGAGAAGAGASAGAGSNKSVQNPDGAGQNTDSAPGSNSASSSDKKPPACPKP